MADDKIATGVDKLRESVQDVSDLFRIVNQPDQQGGRDKPDTEAETQKK